jgi:hypothetical protein
MGLWISFNTRNAAFEDNGHATETGTILRAIAEKIEAGDFAGPVRDGNGNTIGSYLLDDDTTDVEAFREHEGGDYADRDDMSDAEDTGTDRPDTLDGEW